MREANAGLSDGKCCGLQIFKMWNRELYVREQQDAYEFFTSLVDQLDEYLKVKTPEMIKKQPSIHDESDCILALPFK